MKNLICLFSLLMGAISSLGQGVLSQEWTVKITVTDESGRPMQGADVKVIYSTFTPEGKRLSTNISGLSDVNGTFQASHRFTGASAMLFRVSKTGFYATAQPYDLGYDYTVGRWNPEIALVLKKILNPVAMFARRIDANPPVIGKPIGFDLSVGDWVSPDGVGKTSDIFFQWNYTKRSRLDYDGKLLVSFPNNGDGIEQFTNDPSESGSEFRSPHQAPADGYSPSVERLNVSHPPETAKWDYDPNRYYFFRVRTVLGDNGNVKSALYGKIYGDFMHFTYYLNPTPNDRNIEFDPKRNLLVGQNVTAP